jgi:hypothetical protein
MKVLGSEKGALGSAAAAPGRGITFTYKKVLKKVVLTLRLIRDTLHEKATSIWGIEVATGPSNLADGIYSRR